MKQEEKDRIRAELPITKLLAYYGATHGSGDAWHCFRHEDKSPSLVANDSRQVATCYSPRCDLKNRRTGKDGLDIFEIIKVVENCNFMQAVEIAKQISGKSIQANKTQLSLLSKKEKPQGNRSFDEIPELTELKEKHLAFLRNRYGERWRWLAKRYDIKGWHYHIAVPITDESVVFIPLDKKKDQVFYRGRNRTVQVFPNRPDEQRQAVNILVVEGEKDVLAAELALDAQGKLGRWAVITNTNGAGNVRPDTPLFSRFDPARVEKVVICYDNDEAGERANQVVRENARAYFTARTQVAVKRFTGKPQGYDIGDYLREKEHGLSGSFLR